MGRVAKFAGLFRVAVLVAAIAVAASNVPGFAGDASTTRIEPKPVYGASVTIEEGVRVFRPLPSEQRVIVNPGGMTPFSLNTYENVPAGTHPVGRPR